MNRQKPAPDQETETTNGISVDYPVGKRQVHSQNDTPKSTRLAKKDDCELESVASRSIN